MKKAILSMSIVFVLSLFSVPVHSQGCVEATSDAGPQLVGYIQPEFGHYFYGKDNNDNARKPSSFYFRRA
ncbi:MAG: hypothetical protein DRI88_12690, partial [Bacteroidetes bacterium]